jgi:hypothetical protein
LIVKGSTTGKITYKRYVADDDWRMVSAPVKEQSIPNFVLDLVNDVPQSASANYGVSYYKSTNTSGKRWTYHNTTPATVNQEELVNFNSGQGYSVKRSNSGTYTFTGDMANQDVIVPIPVISGGTHMWSLIGNPFPSFLPANSNVEGVLKDNIGALDESFAFLYFWDLVAKQFVPKGYLDTDLQLVPGESFMVRAKDDDNKTFTFSKALQKHTSEAATFYGQKASTIPSISVNLTNGALNKSTDLKFLDNTTSGLDPGYDAGDYQDGTPSFSINTHLVSGSQGIDFTIQCLPTSSLDSEVAIPLSVYATINEELTFSVVSNYVPEGISVYLEDALNNTFTNLTVGALKITNTAALSGIGRFYLHTSSEVLSTETNLVGGTIINLYKTSNRTIKITGLTSTGSATFKMFNISGKEVLATKFIAQKVKEISLPTSLSTGVYIVRVVAESGTFHKKMLIE